MVWYDFLSRVQERGLSEVNENTASYGAGGVGTETLEVLEGAEQYNRWIVKFFRPYLGHSNLELGAGRGTLTQIVSATHNVTPFEITETHRQFIQRRFLGHPKVMPCRADLLDCQDWESFDCIYSANVLEHIEDDSVILAHSARLIRRGGWCVAFVPAHPFLYSTFDRALGHFRRYSRADRLRLRRIEAQGAVLELQQCRYVNFPGALGWLLFMRLLRRHSIDPNFAAIVGHLLPVIWMLDALHLPFGQNVVLAWRRTS